MKFAWCSDTHLDHLRTEQQIIGFAESLVEDGAEGVLITGDIANGRCIKTMLEVIGAATQAPSYFVLGNHDFYGSSIIAIREEVTGLRPNLHYMTTQSFRQLTPKTAVVGHDGWYDMRFGDYITSPFALADWEMIDDFADKGAITRMGVQLQGCP